MLPDEALHQSDNGTNFVARDKELLHNVRNWNQLAESLVEQRIKWKFNPPSAPHQRGVWERLVRSVKHVFYAVFGNRLLTDEILATTFCLVEQSLNARPLVPATADATNMDALTPNHFLFGTSGSLRFLLGQSSLRSRPLLFEFFRLACLCLDEAFQVLPAVKFDSIDFDDPTCSLVDVILPVQSYLLSVLHGVEAVTTDQSVATFLRMQPIFGITDTFCS